MDLWESFANPNKSLESIKIKYRTPSVKVVTNCESYHEDELAEFVERLDSQNNTDYAKEYQIKEENIYTEVSQSNAMNDGDMSQVDNIDDMLSASDLEEVNRIKEENLMDVYTKYPFNKVKLEELSIDSYRPKILSFVYANSVLIIQGPTGCGKTTQVPQFILDDCRANSKYCKIAVTQPRRIAAVSVAKRVCEERGWALGTVCGYQVGLEKNASNDTLITYMTTGVLLQKLVKQKNLHEFTHIIVDEVHERNQDMDFLLLIIRKFLFTSSSKVKIILMSATFDTDTFAHYFRTPSRNVIYAAPVLNIPKQFCQKYQVSVFHINDLKSLGPIPEYNIDEPQLYPSLYKLCVNLLTVFDRLDSFENGKRIIGNVLIFLPGILEIEEMHKHLQHNENSSISDTSKNTDEDKVKWISIPLHSSITMEEQRKIFELPQAGYRKIILSTNIAESSLTVPGINYVIDFCLTKTMIMDPHTQYQSLQLQWASMDNCIQRAGRVGRLADGRVYYLVTRDFFNCLPRSPVPEILRAPLERVVLATKLLNLNEPPKAILALAMNPPNLSSIESTIWNLKEAGGLLMTRGGQKMASDGDLTFLGHVMASLPLDIRLSKFIVLGHMFSCIDSCIIMACGMSLNKIFSSPFMAYLKSYSNRLQWADGSCSDLIAYLNLYRVWQKKKRSAFTRRDLEKRWVENNYVSLRALKEWEYLVKEVTNRVKDLGLEKIFHAERTLLSEIELPIVLKVVMCGAFYPNYFQRALNSGQVDERETVRVLNGLDPCNTIYFTNFDPYQPGPLYADRIKEIFTKNGITYSTDNIKVTFDSSSKVYVSFVHNNEPKFARIDGQDFMTIMPGKIAIEVYKSIRMRQIRPTATIKVLKTDDSWQLAAKYGIDSESQRHGYVDLIKKTDTLSQPILPGVCDKHVRIKISEMTDAGHFWAQHADTTSDNILNYIFKLLNDQKLENVDVKDLKNDEIYAARYNVDNKMYRCRVVDKRNIGGSQGRVNVPGVLLIYIDYGNTAVMDARKLFYLPQEAKDIAPQAMECMLSEVQPSLVLNQRGLWTQRANQEFERYTEGVILTGKIYSVVKGVVHLQLYRTSNFQQDSINEWLIKKGYAQKCEESYLSRENKMKRDKAQSDEGSFYAGDDEEMYEKTIKEISAPPEDSCPVQITLKGPNSPLEMKIFSMVASGIDKFVRIDGNSVNTVLLDTDPQDSHDRLVVAARVDQNVTGKNLILRHTTVMPNIHGFSMLMTLLFCPTVECKPTADGSKVAAILCGLGTDDNGKSLYPAHDLVLTLDTELTEEDLNMINELRFWMNLAVSSMDDIRNEKSPSIEVKICQMEIKNRLFDLLKYPREDTTPESVKYENIWGKLLFDAEQLKPGEDTYTADDVIWPLHSFIKLNKEAKKLHQVTDNVNELEEIARRMKPMNTVTCKVCSKTFEQINKLRIHLSSAEHKERYAAVLNSN